MINGTALIRRTKGALALLCALLPLSGAAQEFSYDGNRWYEVEVIIFTNAPLGSYQEHALPGETVLEYPSRLIPLTPASASLGVNFGPDPALPAIAGAGLSPDAFAPPQAPPLYGPRFSPAAPRAFRLTDLARDAFVALAPEQQQLGQALQRLQSSGGHRVLYHASWRQPGMSRAQSQAVFVRGGERYGEHNELEGSVMLTYIPGGVNMDVNLWLSSFRAAGLRDADPRARARNADPRAGGPNAGLRAGARDTGAAAGPGDAGEGAWGRNIATVAWTLPPQPFPAEEAPPPALPPGSFVSGGASRRPAFDAPLYRIAEVARLRQSRKVSLDVLSYFDHPALGVLVQVRPYVLPLPEGLAAE